MDPPCVGPSLLPVFHIFEEEPQESIRGMIPEMGIASETGDERRVSLNYTKKFKERDRRDQMSQSVLSLRQIVPGCSDSKKVSRHLLMVKTIERIQALERDRCKLYAENQQLKDRCRKLFCNVQYQGASSTEAGFAQGSESLSSGPPETENGALHSGTSRHAMSNQTLESLCSVDLARKADNSQAYSVRPSSRTDTTDFQRSSGEEQGRDFTCGDRYYPVFSSYGNQNKIKSDRYDFAPQDYGTGTSHAINRKTNKHNYLPKTSPTLNPSQQRLPLSPKHPFDFVTGHLVANRGLPRSDQHTYLMDVYYNTAQPPVSISPPSNPICSLATYPTQPDPSGISASSLPSSSFADEGLTYYNFYNSQLLYPDSPIGTHTQAESLSCDPPYIFVSSEQSLRTKPRKIHTLSSTKNNASPYPSQLYVGPNPPLSSSDAGDPPPSQPSSDITHMLDCFPNSDNESRTLLLPGNSPERSLSPPPDHGMEWNPVASIGDIEDTAPWPLRFNT